MSFHLLYAGAHGLLASDRPVIKAADAERIGEASALLARAERILAEAQAEADALRAEGRNEGLREGIAAVRTEVTAALTRMAGDLAAASARRDEELAGAALAAVKVIIGDSAPEIIGPALVRQAIASFADGGPVEVVVGPDLARSLEDDVARDPAITVVVEPDSGPLDCELRLTSGTIRAGLDVQLRALAERWGLPRTSAA